MAAVLAEVSSQDPSRLVLVVDDDKLARKAVVDHLNKLGYETVEAASGFEAIRVAAVMKPGTVVVDGLLPNMHGFEVSRFIPCLGIDLRAAGHHDDHGPSTRTSATGTRPSSSTGSTITW